MTELEERLNEIVRDKSMSDLTFDMLIGLVCDWNVQSHTQNETLDGIERVLHKEQDVDTDLGEGFTERVLNALSYTPDPFDVPCRYDLP